MNEMLRKLIVSLKRKPQTIAMLSLVIAFLVYSLNLTAISNTTAKIQGSGMGLCGFTTMLLSILSFVCFLNAFPYRKKVNMPMLVLMFAIVIFCDGFYMRAIQYAVTRADNPIAITENTAYISKAMSILKTHIAALCVTIVLIVLMPVYKKWLRSIKTSVDVEDNGQLGTIEIEE